MSSRAARSAGPLHGRVAVITGVSRRRGIGAAIARRLAELGAELLISSFSAHDAAQPWGADAEGVDGILAWLRALDVRVEHREADFLDPAAPQALMEAAASLFGHVDILVANHARSDHQDLAALTAAELDAQWAVNVRATLLLVQAFAAQHDGRAGGRVILMTSGQHLEAMPGELGYVATKGALHQLTRTLSASLIARGITVNTVNPGPTDTGWAPPELHARILQAHPQKRWGQPEDAARLIGWLVTDDASWITGQVIDSTGGWS